MNYSITEFFSNLRVLAFVMDSLRKAVLSLESKKTTLSDCFLSLARLAAALKKLPKSFNAVFRNHCVRVINQRYNEFDEDIYFACFFWIPDIEVHHLKIARSKEF
jgi:molecular chaperone GrpE (heat shock protein)